MLERNSSETFAKSGKLHPERWYDMDRSLRLNIVLTYEARVYDAVLQGGPDHKHSCHTTEPKMAVYFKISTISPDSASLIPRVTCRICARLDKRIGCFVVDLMLWCLIQICTRKTEIAFTGCTSSTLRPRITTMRLL